VAPVDFRRPISAIASRRAASHRVASRRDDVAQRVHAVIRETRDRCWTSLRWVGEGETECSVMDDGGTEGWMSDISLDLSSRGS